MNRIREWRPDVAVVAMATLALSMPWLAQWSAPGGASSEAGEADLLPPLITASAEGRIATIQRLLWRGADVDVTDPLGNTPLFYAAMFDRDDVARLLLQAGADPARRNSDGLTPLAQARKYCARRCVGLLRAATQPSPCVPDDDPLLVWAD